MPDVLLWLLHGWMSRTSSEAVALAQYWADGSGATFIIDRFESNPAGIYVTLDVTPIVFVENQ